MLIVHCAESRGKGRKLAECAARSAPAVCTGTRGQPLDGGTEARTASQVVTQVAPGAFAQGPADRERRLLWMTGQQGQAQDILPASTTSEEVMSG